MSKKIFVFASNLKGIHGAGSALEAKQNWGAIQGIGIGPQGDAYAIPTKDERLKPLTRDRIKVYVERFRRYVDAHPEMRFEVVAIGCGLAGYSPDQIAPMFRGMPGNVNLPQSFVQVIARRKVLP